MRIPFLRAYRAFRELDQFSDAECRRFVRATLRQFRARAIGARIVGLVIGLVFCVPAFTLALYMFQSMFNSRWGQAWHASLIVPLLVVLAASLVGGIAGLAWFDRWLGRAIRLRLRTTVCPKCAYSLLGLGVRGGEVVCPECGDRIVLAAHGLTPDDLLIPTTPPHTA